MKRKELNSSNIVSIGHDAKEQILEVEFHDGGVYQYYGVPESEYTGIMNADSHGKYLHRNIKGRYSYQRVA